MPDSIQPVGAMVNADPNQAFTSLNNILGIQGKRQALQIQGQQLQQQTMATQKQSAYQNFFTNFDPFDHLDPNTGITDLGSVKQSAGYKNAGPARDLIDEKLLAIQNSQIANKSTFLGLNQDQRKAAAESVGDLVNDPDVMEGGEKGKAKVKERLAAIGSTMGEGAQKIAQTFIPLVDQAKPGDLSKAIQGFQAQALDSGSQINLRTPTLQGVQGKKGFNYVNTNPNAAPAVGAQVGQTVTDQGIAPAMTPLPNGQVGVVDRSGGVSAAPERTPGVNPTAPQMIGQRGQAEAVTGRVSQALNQANNTVQAQDALTRAKAILESPTSPKTGANFESVKSLKNLMSSLGVDTQGADDMNTLAKNLARFEAARATASGLGGTDAARELAHAGSPNTGLDNKAALSVVNQSLATEKALASYAKVQSKTSDPQTLLKNENDFRNIPHLVEAHEYGMSRNSKEADDYLARHNISHAQMKQSRDAIKEFDNR